MMKYNLYGYTRALILFVLSVAVGINYFNEPGCDWILYKNVAQLFHDGLSVYHVLIPMYPTSSTYYLYSPVFAFALYPITFIPFTLAYTLWNMIKVILLYRTFKILAGVVGFNKLDARTKSYFIFILFAFLLRFLLYDFDLGQLTVFLLWLMVEGWNQLQRGKILLATLLLSAGLFIKMFSIIFIPYLIYKRKFRALLFLMSWITFFALLPFAFYNFSYVVNSYKEWVEVINPANPNAENLSRLHVQDLHTAIPAWYNQLSEWFHHFFQFNDIDVNVLKVISFLIIGIFISILLLLPKKKNFHSLPSYELEWVEISYMLGIIPLIFPLQQKYTFIFMMPVLIRIINNLLNNKLNNINKLLFCFSFLFMVVSTDGIIGREWNNVTEELKFITIGAILLILLFLSTSDKRLKKEF